VFVFYDTYSFSVVNIQEKGGCISMAPKVTISVPDDLHEKMQEWKDAFNYSGIFQEAVKKAIARKESFQKKIREENPTMEQVVERLRMEKEESEESWFQNGKDEGLIFAKLSHYDAIKLVVDASDLDDIEKQLREYDETYWDEKYRELRQELDTDYLEGELRYYEWQRGFIQGVTEFWDEVKELI